MTIVPKSTRAGLLIEASSVEGTDFVYTEGDFLRGLADDSGCAVILDPVEHRAAGGSKVTPATIRGMMGRGSVARTLNRPFPASRSKDLLLFYGSRVLELRFPRRAYLVRRDEPEAQ